MMNDKNPAQNRFRTTLIIGLTALPLMLAGCGKDEDEARQDAAKAIEQAAKAQGQDVKVNIDGNKTTIESTDEKGQKVTYEASDTGATITSADGNMTMNTGDAAKIPDNYPADGVRYPGMTLDMAMAQDKAFMLGGSTTDPADKVLAELQSQATSQGWQAQGTFQQGPMNMLTYMKGERAMSITLNTEEGKTTLSITVAE